MKLRLHARLLFVVALWVVAFVLFLYSSPIAAKLERGSRAVAGSPIPPAEILVLKEWVIEQAIKMLAILLGVMAALLTVAGWLGRVWAKAYVEQTVSGELKRLYDELFGRFVGYFGLVLWRMSKAHPDPFQQQFLDNAIDFTRAAYERLHETNPWRMTAANNLAFYLAERGQPDDAAAAVKYATMVLEEYGRTGDIELITTYARVVAQYPDRFDHPRQTLLDAEKMMERLIASDKVPPMNKTNAQAHLEKIRAALDQRKQ